MEQGRRAKSIAERVLHWAALWGKEAKPFIYTSLDPHRQMDSSRHRTRKVRTNTRSADVI